MRHEGDSFYILHVSDFHISENSDEAAKAALKAVTDKIKEMNINVKYLIHTGDMIDSRDLKEETDDKKETAARSRFQKAKSIIMDLKKELDITQKNMIICCGNHDIIRYKNKDKDVSGFFKDFLKSIYGWNEGTEQELTELRKLDDLNVLVLNTNGPFAEKKGACIECDKLKKVLCEEKNAEQPNWFYSDGEKGAISKEESKVNIIVAHKPLYEICEDIRLPYGSELQTTDFLSELQDFINGNGFYLCGDKHTSSIAASYIHDIPHYFCGHPFALIEDNSKKKDKQEGNNVCKCKKEEKCVIDYNLIEIKNKKIGKVRKIHLEQAVNIPDEFPSAVRRYENHFLEPLLCILNHNFYRNIRKGCYAPQMRQSFDKYSHRPRTVIKRRKVLPEYRNPDFKSYKFAISDHRNIQAENKSWKCQVHPIDTTVSKLYEKSKKYIVKNSFALLASKTDLRYNSWFNLSWRNLFNRYKNINFKRISEFYILFCRLKDSSNELIEWANDANIFDELCEIITESMNDVENINTQNIINVRGDYSSGKSTFLGILYICLLYRYSQGEIDYIPAYFNMENDDILNKIQEENTYAVAVKQTFTFFVEEIEKIAEREQASVCYIVDGLDEQDIWSESSGDSVGRVALDILSKTKHSKYVMSFCQNKLAHFKNTMPVRKYYEKSYVMYFNPVLVREKNDKNIDFVQFVRHIIDSNTPKNRNGVEDNDLVNLESEKTISEPRECPAIRKLGRLFINPGFIYHNYQYLKECEEGDSGRAVYMRYIDQQYRICLDALEYNFIHYAPAMAYLFTYEGYTYEKFKSISPSTNDYWEQKILEYSSKIYKTFIFIKKHKDAREYLLALHYNRELRYYAENPNAEIQKNSIINRLIPRNISIIIKKLWWNDQNKFVIVCRNLIEKHKNEDISSCTLSMLIYILAYLDKMPGYVYDEIKKLLIDTANKNGGDKRTEEDSSEPWNINIAGENSRRMKKFMDLDFLYSKEILDAINNGSSIALTKKLLESPSFRLYNRQYLMWYYGDLTIYGENRINNLEPGKDIIYKGVDYYKCFYTIYHKLYVCFENKCADAYPLLEYELFTICDLVNSRKLDKKVFSRDEKEIIGHLIEILNEYVSYGSYGKENTKREEENDVKEEERISEFEESFSTKTGGDLIEHTVNHLEKYKEGYCDNEYIRRFFKLLDRVLLTL